MKFGNNERPFSREEIERGIQKGKTIADLKKDRQEKTISFNKDTEVSSDPLIAAMRENIKTQVEEMTLDFFRFLKKFFPDRDANLEIKKALEGKDIEGLPEGENKIAKLIRVANTLEGIQQEKKSADTREFLLFAEEMSDHIEQKLNGIQEFVEQNFESKKMSIDLSNQIQEVLDHFADMEDKIEIVGLIEKDLQDHPDKQMFSGSPRYLAGEITSREELIAKRNRIRDDVRVLQRTAMQRYFGIMNLLNSTLLN